jgi:hypothetical protein
MQKLAAAVLVLVAAFSGVGHAQTKAQPVKNILLVVSPRPSTS